MVIISDCTDCKHFRADKENKEIYCSGFPGPIPWDIFCSSRRDKKECAPGIKWEPDEEQY